MKPARTIVSRKPISLPLITGRIFVLLAAASLSVLRFSLARSVAGGRFKSYVGVRTVYDRLLPVGALRRWHRCSSVRIMKMAATQWMLL